MAKLTDLPQIAQYGIVAVLAVAIVAGSYYMLTAPIKEQNTKDAAVLKQKQDEIAQLAPYETKVADLDRQISSLNQQLELQKRIVPDEKEVPSFMTMVQGEAQKSGIEIRRYTAKPAATKEFFTEVPFEVDVDGPYYAVLDFYQRLGQLERIVNVSNVVMATTKNAGAARVKKTYPYAPTETVVTNFTATTFYSVTQPATPAPAAKK
jgi:type IV pilus assembly protein PilO